MDSRVGHKSVQYGKDFKGTSMPYGTTANLAPFQHVSQRKDLKQYDIHSVYYIRFILQEFIE